jgi:hypothetical protein
MIVIGDDVRSASSDFKSSFGTTTPEALRSTSASIDAPFRSIHRVDHAGFGIFHWLR